jgi:hypothetical protein
MRLLEFEEKITNENGGVYLLASSVSTSTPSRLQQEIRRISPELIALIAVLWLEWPW